MRAYERLIKYAMVPTASNENSAAVPTTQCQFNLAHILVEELKAMGIEDGDIIKIEDFEFEYYDEDYFED